MMSKKSLIKITLSLIIVFIAIPPRSYASADSLHSQTPFLRRMDPPSRELKLSPIPTLPEFIASLEKGDQDQVVGIYIPRILAVRVIQQPINDPGFVSNSADVVTQFSLADLNGSNGFLAHNNNVGEHFFELSTGHHIFLIYGTGDYRRYSVSESLRFQALSPQNPYSSFRELGHLNPIFSTGELFAMIYGKHDRVILQTCIEEDNNPNWGRYFVVAIPSRVLPDSNIRFQE